MERLAVGNPSHASRTLTNTNSAADNGGDSYGVLRLTGDQNQESSQSDARVASSSSNHIKWDDSVIDNENLGKKKSKICCIYSKPFNFDEQCQSDSECSDCDQHNLDDPDVPNAYEQLDPHVVKSMRHVHKKKGNVE